MGMTTGSYKGSNTNPLAVNTGLVAIKSLTIYRIDATGKASLAYASDALATAVAGPDPYVEIPGAKSTGIKLYGPQFQIAAGHPYNAGGCTYVWEACCP